MMRWLLVLLLVALVLASPATLAQGGDDHPPIRIEGDADLALPAAVAENGVRGGTGSPGDPWRISGWHIPSQYDAPAIVIRDVQGHVLLEDLTLVSHEHDEGKALVVEGSPHVTVRRVHVTGEGSFGTFERSGVRLEDVHVDADNGGRFNCVYAWLTHLTLRNVTIDGLCGSRALTLLDVTFDGERVRLRDVGNGIVHGGGGESFRLVDAEITATAKKAPSWVKGVSLGYEGLDLSVTDGLDEVRVEDARVSGFEWSCIGFTGHPTRTRASVDLRDVTVEDCPGTGISMFNLGDSEVRGRDLRVVGNAWGVSVSGSSAVLERVAVAGNDLGVRANASRAYDGDVTVAVRSAAFQGNDVDARADPGASLVLEDAWWPREPVLEGGVDVRERAEEPPVAVPSFASRENEVPSPGVLPVLAAITALGAFRRRR